MRGYYDTHTYSVVCMPCLSFCQQICGSSTVATILRICGDSSAYLTDCRHFVNMPETRRLARIVCDGSWRNRAVAERDRRAEP